MALGGLWSPALLQSLSCSLHVLSTIHNYLLVTISKSSIHKNHVELKLHAQLPAVDKFDDCFFFYHYHIYMNMYIKGAETSVCKKKCHRNANKLIVGLPQRLVFYGEMNKNGYISSMSVLKRGSERTEREKALSRLRSRPQPGARTLRILQENSIDFIMGAGEEASLYLPWS